MYIANVNLEDGFENNPYLTASSRNRRQRRLFGRGSGVCRRRSFDIAELDDDERDEFMAESRPEEPG